MVKSSGQTSSNLTPVKGSDLGQITQASLTWECKDDLVECAHAQALDCIGVR